MRKNSSLGVKIKDIINRTRDHVFNEADTRRVIIDPILNALNWKTDKPIHVKCELNASPGFIDYALFKNKDIDMIIEAKSVDSKPLDTRKNIAQIMTYGSAVVTHWGILTNGQEWLIYNLYSNNDLNKRLLCKIDLLIASEDEIVEFFTPLVRTNFSQSQMIAKWEQSNGKINYEIPVNPTSLNSFSEAERLTKMVSYCEKKYNCKLTKHTLRQFRNVYKSEDGRIYHFSTSKEYRKDSSAMFIKLKEGKLTGDFYNIYHKRLNFGFSIPCSILSDFFTLIPRSKANGPSRWDPRIECEDGKWTIFTDKETHGTLDITRYFGHYMNFA